MGVIQWSEYVRIEDAVSREGWTGHRQVGVIASVSLRVNSYDPPSRVPYVPGQNFIFALAYSKVNMKTHIHLPYLKIMLTKFFIIQSGFSPHNCP